MDDGKSGTVAFTLISTSNVGDLELHIFRVDPQGFLHEISRDVTPGVSRTTPRFPSPREEVPVEIKGRNSRLGVMDSSAYELYLTSPEY
jgi:hypothetical protein